MFIDKPFQTDPRHDPQAIVRSHDCSRRRFLETLLFDNLRRLLRWGAIVVCAGAMVACGGGGSASAAGGDAGSDPVAASFALYQAALQAGQSQWEALPHTDIASDLAAVAKRLVSSGVATDTYVSANAVTATLTDGQRFFLVYDDRDITSTLPASTSGLGKASSPWPTATARSAAGRKRMQATDTFPSLPSTQHQIVFFVNTADPSAFDVGTQATLREAFTKAGFNAPAYGVDGTGLLLDEIIKLGSSPHPIDYLSIATHGGVSCKSDNTACRYHWGSNTAPDIANWKAYYNDIQAEKVGGGGVLKLKTVHDAESFDFSGAGMYWFTPEFLTAHLQFNPGAVVANSSCHGQNQDIAAGVAATFAKAGVGLYSGWTGSALSWDADQSDAYLLDRLLGETVDTGLKALVLEGGLPLIKQRTPAQRPFPLTDVIAAMQTTLRPANPGNTQVGHTLTATTNRNGFSKLVFTTLNGGGANSKLLIWGLPSIAKMTTIERPTGGTLFVDGTFPATPGKGQIVDASGTYPLTPTAWSTTRIQFPLPPGGNGAAGVVTVFSAEGVGSNAVPLTEWKGQLLVTVNDTATSMNDSRGGVVVPGIGSGTIKTATDLHFRADVHPVIAEIDTVPEPRNFVFSGVMGDSRTSLTSAAVTFRSSDGTKSAQFSLAQPVTVQTPVYAAPVSPGTFIVSPYTGADAPAGCNSGLPGPRTSGPANVFCPFGGIYVANALMCSDSDGTLCIAPMYDYTGYYGYPPFVVGSNYVSGYDGQLAFTLNPTTYEITFTSKPAALVEDYLFSTAENLSITLSATIQPPLHAPTR